MFCGLCVEPCPTGSIQHTREFEASQKSIRNLVFRWADPLRPFPVYKVPKGIEYYPRATLGSPCGNCVGAGCRIYETRPLDPCRTFNCAWRAEGSVLAEGSLAQVQADPRVIEVYLGR